MIEIKYTNDEFSLKFDEGLAVNTLELLTKLLDEVKKFPVFQKIEAGEIFNPIESKGLLENSVAELRPFELDRKVIRERLPNSLDDNVIDISKVDMEKPSITKHTHFRCSDCGQSVLTVVNDVVVMRDLENKEDNLCILTGADIDNFDYEESKAHVTDVGACLVADGNTKAHCPMCSSEKHIELWVDAYENPLKYFECETPCPICGTETVYSVDRSGESVVKCDDATCGYELKEVR